VLDEEAKAAQEVAKSAGKALDIVHESGGFLGEIFGEPVRQFGGVVSDWSRYYRYQNLLRIGDKIRALHEARAYQGSPVPVPPEFILPLIDGASLESNEKLQALWAGLVANATAPEERLNLRKIYIEILRGLEPLDAEVLQLLAEPGLLDRYEITTDANLNAEEIAGHLATDPEEVKVSLQTLARYSCVIDAWEQTIESVDHGYGGFRVNNPKGS